jgi:hypothetical protein
LAFRVTPPPAETANEASPSEPPSAVSEVEPAVNAELPLLASTPAEELAAARGPDALLDSATGPQPENAAVDVSVPRSVPITEPPAKQPRRKRSKNKRRK